MGDKPDVRMRRAYDEPEPDDGIRVLVDRIWPRGLTKDKARLDQWLKQVAPSTELRKRVPTVAWKATFDTCPRARAAPTGERFRLKAPGSRRNADVAAPGLLGEGGGRVGDPIGQLGRGRASRIARAAWMSAAWVRAWG